MWRKLTVLKNGDIGIIRGGTRGETVLFLTVEELMKFLQSDYMTELNSIIYKIKQQFKNVVTRLIDVSFDVSDKAHTLFTIKISLEHDENSSLKGLLGRNKYLDIFLCVMQPDDEDANELTYSLSYLDREYNKVFLSTKNPNSIIAELLLFAENVFSFPIKMSV